MCAVQSAISEYASVFEYIFEYPVNRIFCDVNKYLSFLGVEKMKSMSQLAVLSRRWRPSEMKLDSFQEVVLESSSVEELKEKVKCVTSFLWYQRALLMSSVCHTYRSMYEQRTSLILLKPCNYQLLSFI